MSRNLNIAFLMDPLETLDLKGDTTFALALEAQRRKHKISFFEPKDLILKSNNVYADICKLELFSRNNLSEYEEQMLINIVSELKMNYIETKQSVDDVNGASGKMDKKLLREEVAAGRLAIHKHLGFGEVND